jgi:hypothetical protein
VLKARSIVWWCQITGGLLVTAGLGRLRPTTTLVLFEGLLRLVLASQRLIGARQLVVHVTILVDRERGFEVGNRLTISPGLHVSAAEQRSRPRRPVRGFDRAFEHRDCVVQLLTLEQRVTVHHQQSAVLGPLARQALEQRKRLVEVVRANERLREGVLDRWIPRFQRQRRANFRNAFRIPIP